MILKKTFIFAFILFFSLISIKSFFSSGFFPMHDDAQVARVIVMARSLSDGQFPVRIVRDLGYGYGYPIFNFYGPLPYYFGGMIHVLGFDALTATKIMMGTGIIIGSIAMYLLSSLLFGNPAGIFSSVLFTFFPYRAVQIYVRGAVGELWAVSFMPLLLYGIILLTRKIRVKEGFIIGILSLSAIILSHTVFGYIAVGCVFAIACFTGIVSLIRKNLDVRKMSIYFFIVCFVSLSLTAFFWLPAMTEMSYTNVSKVIGSTANYKDHYVCLAQLWDSLWGYGGSASGCLDGMSFKLGKLNIIIFVLSVIYWLFKKEKSKRVNSIILALIVSSAILIFSMLSVSEPVWKLIPYANFVQYPWRFLGPLGVSMALVSGYLFYGKKHVISTVFFMVFLAGILLLNLKLFSPQYIYNPAVSSFGSVEELRWRASKVSDEYLPKGIRIPNSASDIVKERVSGNESVEVTILRENGMWGVYEVKTDVSQDLKLNMAYFPGWTYSINGKEVKPKVVDGEPSVILSTGTNLLEMRFLDTVVRKIGNIVTLMTIIGIIVILIYGKKAVSYYRHTGVQRRS